MNKKSILLIFIIFMAFCLVTGCTSQANPVGTANSQINDTVNNTVSNTASNEGQQISTITQTAATPSNTTIISAPTPAEQQDHEFLTIITRSTNIIVPLRDELRLALTPDNSSTEYNATELTEKATRLYSKSLNFQNEIDKTEVSDGNELTRIRYRTFLHSCTQGGIYIISGAEKIRESQESAARAYFSETLKLFDKGETAREEALDLCRYDRIVTCTATTATCTQ